MIRRTDNPDHRDYYPFPESTIRREAANIQQRINNRKRHGISVTSDEVWDWIKSQHPTWPELEREKVFKAVVL